MIKVVSKRVKCACGRTLEYDEEDVCCKELSKTYGIKFYYIKCPVCGCENEIPRFELDKIEY